MTPTARQALLVGGVAAAISLGLVAESSWNATVDRRIVIADAAVGWAFLLGGIAAWAGRPTSAAGRLMVAVGVAWFAGTIWPSLEFLHRGPLFHLLATYPAGRLAWRTGRVGGPLQGVAVGAVYLANVTRLGGDPAVGLAVAMGFLWLAAGGALRTRGTMRRARLSAVLGAAGLGAVIATGSILRLAGTPLGAVGLFAYDAILVATGLGLAIDLLAGRWSEGLLTRAVVDLGDTALSGSVRDRLARSVGDPSLVLAYAVEARPGSFVDELGQPVAMPPPSAGRSITPMTVAGRETGFIAHDAAVLDETLLRTLSAAASLAMSNSRLQTEVRARVAEVDASRERLLHAADAQRRRLGGRLQSGAARRLERVAGLLGRLELAGPAAEASLQALRADLDRARAELADFARGVHPSTLTTAGLAAALAELVRRTPLPIELTVDAEPADPIIEATLYFVCSEALANAAKHAGAASIAIDLRQTRRSLRLLISDDGRGGARLASRGGLRGLADRVEALGGSFGVESPRGGGTTLRVTVPRRERAASAAPHAASAPSSVGGAQ